MIRGRDVKSNIQEGFFRLAAIIAFFVAFLAFPSKSMPMVSSLLLCFTGTWVIYDYTKWIISKYQNKLNKRKGFLGLAGVLSLLAISAGWIYGEYYGNYTFVFTGFLAIWIAYVIARWVIPFIIDWNIVPVVKYIIIGFKQQDAFVEQEEIKMVKDWEEDEDYDEEYLKKKKKEREDIIISHANYLITLHKPLAGFFKFLNKDIVKSQREMDALKEVGVEVDRLRGVEKKVREIPSFIIYNYLNPILRMTTEIQKNFEMLDSNPEYFRQKHHPEFEEEYKRKAKKFLAEGLSLNEISRKLGPSVSTLQTWLGLDKR